MAVFPLVLVSAVQSAHHQVLGSAEGGRIEGEVVAGGIFVGGQAEGRSADGDVWVDGSAPGLFLLFLIKVARISGFHLLLVLFVHFQALQREQRLKCVLNCSLSLHWLLAGLLAGQTAADVDQGRIIAAGPVLKLFDIFPELRDELVEGVMLGEHVFMEDAALVGVFRLQEDAQFAEETPLVAPFFQSHRRIALEEIEEDGVFHEVGLGPAVAFGGRGVGFGGLAVEGEGAVGEKGGHGWVWLQQEVRNDYNQIDFQSNQGCLAITDPRSGSLGWPPSHASVGIGVGLHTAGSQAGKQWNLPLIPTIETCLQFYSPEDRQKYPTAEPSQVIQARQTDPRPSPHLLNFAITDRASLYFAYISPISYRFSHFPPAPPAPIPSHPPKPLPTAACLLAALIMLKHLRRLALPLPWARFWLSTRRSVQGDRKLQLYQKIKEKELKSIKTAPLMADTVDKYYKQHRCDGCNSLLQSEDKQKYGFIRAEVLQEAVGSNVKLIQETYGAKVASKDQATLDMVHEVEKELGVKIFNRRVGRLDNLDNVEVLLRLQEKIDQLEEEHQTIRRTRKQRTEIFCYRCFSLKYHNKLPDEFDMPDRLPENNQEVVLTKVFNKHKVAPTLYLYLVDVLDIAGSLQQYVFDRLLDQDVEFAIVINKLDIVNEKYLNKHLILQEVRRRMVSFLQNRQVTEQETLRKKVEEIEVFMVSSVSKAGIKGLQSYIEKKVMRRIQLVGFPNTGKTTLLNELTRLNKPTSKVPGTTLFITENHYKKNIMYDMPGLHSSQNMYNLISKPNLQSLLAWNKLYSPPVLLHQAFFFGGKVEIQDVRIILFGLGGACASDNRWFMLNYKEFWKGLPPLNELNITKYEFDLVFENGKAEDLEISGWGFISFRLTFSYKKRHTRKLTLYLPKGITFNFRQSALKDTEVLSLKSIVTKRHGLGRVHASKQL